MKRQIFWLVAILTIKDYSCPLLSMDGKNKFNTLYENVAKAAGSVEAGQLNINHRQSCNPPVVEAAQNRQSCRIIFNEDIADGSL
jgi:hypothetical protein